jgi:hypothetical protein
MVKSVQRVLEHGAHPLLSEHPLFQGCNMPPADNLWASARGQLLVEIEFLLGHDCRVCLHTKAHKNMDVIAGLFPNVQFVAYACEEDVYDPEKPQANPLNLTKSTANFTTDKAREWGMCAPDFGPVLLIGGQGETPIKQLMHHALVRPRFSLLVLSDMPPDYLSGELVLPVGTSFASPLVYLVAPGHACARLYYPEHLLDEVAHHQIVARAGEDYDQLVENQIVHAYAARADVHPEAARACLPKG